MKKLIKVLPIVFFAISTVPTVTMEGDDVMPIPGSGDIAPLWDEEVNDEEINDEEQLRNFMLIRRMKGFNARSLEVRNLIKGILARVTPSKNSENDKGIMNLNIE